MLKIHDIVYATTSNHRFVNCLLFAGGLPPSLTQARYESGVFSNNHHLIPPSSYARNESESPPDLVSDGNLKNGYQAVNLFPNCKSAYYFRPYKMAPLQGRFVEIGRVKNSNGFFKIGGFVGSEEVEVDVDDDDIVVQDCEV
ncbi:hypothetical protein L1987_33485 [Smallanthus sonchifolius]|uniref:Uncharacterized protein n=1 Tax=Smallanthus sonchifolius TaxID=185202 RepID=A0ACB9HR71_9ASTR|nr:hypothetical protein L1987_33485 [Smallanthus sonchifolius]